METGYAEVTENTKTPFQKAFNTDLPAYDWLAQHPERAEAFEEMMKLTKSGGWMLGFADFNNEALAAEQNERVFFVDVGGNSGHQCVEVRDRYPALQGRLVLQDRPQVVDELPEIPGVRIEASDFFQEQKVKGKQPPSSFHMLTRTYQRPGSITSAGSSTTGQTTIASESCRTCAPPWPMIPRSSSTRRSCLRRMSLGDRHWLTWR